MKNIKKKGLKIRKSHKISKTPQNYFSLSKNQKKGVKNGIPLAL